VTAASATAAIAAIAAASAAPAAFPAASALAPTSAASPAATAAAGAGGRSAKKRGSFRKSAAAAAAAAEHADLDDGAIICEGFLEKKTGGLRHKWQKRYFALYPGALLYFASAEREAVRGTLDLAPGAFESVEVCDYRRTGDKVLLRIVAAAQMVELRASNEATAATWGEFLADLLAQCNAKAAGGGGSPEEGDSGAAGGEEESALASSGQAVPGAAGAAEAPLSEGAPAAATVTGGGDERDDAAAPAPPPPPPPQDFDGPVSWNVEVFDDLKDEWSAGRATHFNSVTHAIFITGFSNGLEGKVALHHDYFRLVGIAAAADNGPESVACFEATSAHMDRERRLAENSHAFDD